MGALADRIERLMMGAADRALMDVAHVVLEQAKHDAPPTDPEDDPDPTVSIRESGQVRRVARGKVQISFDAPHAAKHHENFRLAHPRGGGPKYLERNVLAASRALQGRLAAEIRAGTSQGLASGGRRHTKRF